MVEPRNAQRLKKPVHELLFQTIGENAVKKANAAFSRGTKPQ